MQEATDNASQASGMSRSSTSEKFVLRPRLLTRLETFSVGRGLCVALCLSCRSVPLICSRRWGTTFLMSYPEMACARR